jgi:hypothetical protein
MNKTQLTQDYIWRNNSRSKLHLDPNCRYCKDATKRPLRAFPENHLDICSNCIDYYNSWESGFTKTYDTSGCERCGRSVEENLCEECFERGVLKR